LQYFLLPGIVFESNEKKEGVFMRHIILFFALIFCVAIAAAEPQKLAVLPLNNSGMDDASVSSIESLFRIELASNDQYEMISEPRIFECLGDTICNDIECAAYFGRRLGADRVITGSVLKLGDKIIFQFMLVEVRTQAVLLKDRISVERVEDFDTVLKRAAKSIVTMTPVAETAEVGLITENEARVSQLRGSQSFFGLSFGYLYGQKGYDNVDRSFLMDVRFGQELTNFEVGMLMGAHKGFAMNIYASYLFSRKDICPYLGSALGFHWISHNEPSYYYDYNRYENVYEDKRSDGFELTINSGVKFLRTFKRQVVANFAYSFAFNDYHDQATMFSIGLLF
jgi:TolB-like protein